MYTQELKEVRDRIKADIDELNQKCQDLVLVDTPEEDEGWADADGFWEAPLLSLFDDDDGRDHDASLTRIYRHNNKCRVQLVSRENYISTIYGMDQLTLEELGTVADTLVAHLLNGDIVQNDLVAAPDLDIEF